jgi:uncharacterized protein (TIGR03435 family)
MMFANNSPIPAFTSFLQSLVLDRPVVDQTGLTGRYDLTVTFTPATPCSAVTRQPSLSRLMVLSPIRASSTRSSSSWD